MDETPEGPSEIAEPAPTPQGNARAWALISTLNEVEMDVAGSADAWRYGGGRDLSRLVERARESAG